MNSAVALIAPSGVEAIQVSADSLMAAPLGHAAGAVTLMSKAPNPPTTVVA